MVIALRGTSDRQLLYSVLGANSRIMAANGKLLYSLAFDARLAIPYVCQSGTVISLLLPISKVRLLPHVSGA